MRLFPAHLREAKQMARDLCDTFQYLNTPRDWTDPHSQPPTLQQSQELMAKAMGYAGWRELSRLVQQPHAAVYLDTMPSELSGATGTELVTRLCRECGLHYAHGHMWNALQLAGVGYSPKRRRRLAENATPWGVIMEEHEPIAEGIRCVSTPTHGGWLLSAERLARVPEHLRNPDGAYEEDGDFNLVVIAFSEEATAFGVSLRDALESLGIVIREFPSPPETPLSEFENRVIDYLVRCVKTNRLPVRFPGEDEAATKDPLLLARAEHYSLEEWVRVLSGVPTINGSWSTRDGPWFEHWDWRCRELQRSEAFAASCGGM